MDDGQLNSELNHTMGLARSLVRDHKVATPFLLIDEDRVFETLNLFDQHLSGVHLFYAVKANPSPSLIRFFVDRGMSLDVASAGEISAAITLGVPSERLFVSTPIKTTATREAMFNHRVAYCAVDSIDEIERLASHRQEKRTTHVPKIFVRLRIDSKDVEVDLNTKFGCSISEAIDIIERGSLHGLQFGGISFHVGSQCTNVDNYFLGIESAMAVAKEAFSRFNIQLPAINIGGGFCEPLAAQSAGIRISDFYASIGQACQKAIDGGFKVFAEPGRCLVSAAGALVTSVVGTNVRNEQRWAYLDDGIYGCYSNKLYEHPNFEFHCLHSVRSSKGTRFNKLETSRTKPAREPWTVAGPTCDSLDVVAENVALPVNLAHGDILLTPNIGAYSISTACTFNGFNPPHCYLVRGALKNGKLRASILSDELLSDKLPTEKVSPSKRRPKIAA